MEIICEDKQILQNRTRTYYFFDHTRYIEIMAAEHKNVYCGESKPNDRS